MTSSWTRRVGWAVFLGQAGSYGLRELTEGSDSGCGLGTRPTRWSPLDVEAAVAMLSALLR